ncbi:MAG: preprotein translocase subunit SecG [Zetaproteobacteria bacterium CG12_big_fil_rev_8_21_14_0_65_54_13]|nr:MAG: preprotein translocase subunit SecG [Zetaproteobacteria bacterium CG23_combo_of_CG06-09_8_20_14_all_54_7]PIW48262.1 MAG: preprotein translocase subunit SecG [Zetaproteobacteria bacterium CG12_big_fil_rev_8_21_14_0_65_54_13]PIX54562.1 MAG: preprotein translocase subunit SecG [Zetaproteobacteria bacterium CG_4_10_14_3_um_filter_54_28]PJA29720.1 MAG: preprotein translocase subunit SecG [Zetaproteobacteria bacterium CG_4_9_14_3_um_filter_54_145]
MTTILIIVHVLIALLLIGTVLIQRGQGADMGVSFGGGGAQTLFGSRGSGSFLGKLTGGLAAAFMMTSLTLAFFSQQQTGSVVDRSVAGQTIPVEQNGTAPAQQEGFDPSMLKSDAPASSTADTLPSAE